MRSVNSLKIVQEEEYPQCVCGGVRDGGGGEFGGSMCVCGCVWVCVCVCGWVGVGVRARSGCGCVYKYLTVFCLWLFA